MHKFLNFVSANSIEKLRMRTRPINSNLVTIIFMLDDKECYECLVKESKLHSHSVENAESSVQITIARCCDVNYLFIIYNKRSKIML